MGRMVEISRVKAELPTSYRTQRFSRRVIFCVCSIGTTLCQSCFRCLPVYHRNVKNTVISLQNPPASRPARKNRPPQAVKIVPTGRHVRTVGTPTGKFGAGSVRGRQAERAVQRQILSPGEY